MLSTKIACDQQGNNLGYGYVQFEKKEDAEKAIKTDKISLNGSEV